MKTASAKAKGRKCRRCEKDYEATFQKQRVCSECRTKCSGCSAELTEDTHDATSFRKGKSFRCKKCVASGVRNTPGRKERQKEYDLKRHYGISLEDFKRMSKTGCQICYSSNRLVVDHCHDTGIVRGVLCSQCNTGLGMFKDTPGLLKAAANYLEEQRENF